MLTKYWNPYLEEYMATVGCALPTYGEEHYAAMSGKLMSSFMVRDKCIKEYAFAIPNEEAIEALIHYGPVVEIGCGLGYWAKLVQDAGGEIIPYDANVNDMGMVKLYMSRDEYMQPHTKIFRGGAETAKLHSDKTLFLCWPPYDDSMAYECLKTHLVHGGQTLIYVGEDSGGCTGDKKFHNLIEAQMKFRRSVEIPVWPGIHDCMEIYTCKRETPPIVAK